MTAPLFADSSLQEHYEKFGYAVFHALDKDLIDELREYYRSLTLQDHYGIGYNVSLYSSDPRIRAKAQETLVTRAFPALEPFLADREPYMATFLVKEPGGHLIPPHQDWSHCDETKHDSVMCWIPLGDADEHNGGLGFVSGSHRYFDYLRAFPYQIAGTPVYRHEQKLIPFLNILHMNAGDVVVFNNRISHGSLPNYTAEARIACSFALHPRGEPLLGYYLKPNGRIDTLLRYEVTPEFYLEYPNPRMYELYSQGVIITGYRFEEVAYQVPAVEWEALEARLIATGNHRDPWKVAKAEEILAARRGVTKPGGAAGTGRGQRP